MAEGTLNDFLAKVRCIQSLMVLVSTGKAELQEKEQEYGELRKVLATYFHAYELIDPNQFATLMDFYGYYRSKMLTYEERRDFVKKLYERTELDIESKQKKTMENKAEAPAVQKVQATTAVAREAVQDSRKVLVVYGRNEKARINLFTFLRTIGLQPFEWSELVKATGQGSPYIAEVLKKGFSEAKAIIVLFTPDDEGRLKEEFRKKEDPSYETELSAQARQNVVFEAGMALGYCAKRTILVELGTLRPFSDISGLHVVRLDNSTAKRQELAQRLLTLKCAVNLSGIDWHTVGDFTI